MSDALCSTTVNQVPQAEDETPRVGISRCLLGENVRYDGGHQLDRFLRDTLGRFVEFVGVCPEVECGMPTPRDSLRLVGDPENPRLVTRKTGEDHTKQMKIWTEKALDDLASQNLCGFVFKSRSPSSGLHNIKVYNEETGQPVSHKGRGIFASAFMERFPLLPVEDDGRLHDPLLREMFIERIFLFRRLRSSLARDMSRHELIEFHASHKLLFMSHSPENARDLGSLVGRIKERPIEDVYCDYLKIMHECLERKPTPSKHRNVLQHALGYFKNRLTSDEKQEVLEIIDHYHQGHVPLIVPVTLINHFTRKYDEPYLGRQYYLKPHPLELALRNHS
ncbi:MAG: YbgA family protein [Oceanidesulfovibrio sp.]